MATNIKNKNRIKTKKRTTSRNRSSATENENNSYALTILKGFSVGITIFLILISFFALLMAKFDFDYNVITVFAILASIISTFIAGFWTTRRTGKKGLITGITASIPIIIFILVLALIASRGSLGIISLIAAVLVILFGALGGIAAVNMKKKSKIK